MILVIAIIAFAWGLFDGFYVHAIYEAKYREKDPDVAYGIGVFLLAHAVIAFLAGFAYHIYHFFL